MFKGVMAAFAATAALSILTVSAATAQIDRFNVKWGIQSEPTSLDPHFSRQGPNKAIARHMFDALVLLDRDMRPQPGLALSWEPLSDLQWEVKLRPNVKFHDGTDFTAEHVAKSFARVETIINSPSPYTVFTMNIDRVEIVDPLTIRIHTKEAYPLLPQAMGEVYIVSESGTSSHPNGLVGTGAYVLDSFSLGQSYKLKRNENYWGEKPQVERVEFKILRNSASRIAALLSGELDLIENPSSADHARLRNDPNFKLVSTVSYRIVYIGVDQQNEKAPEGVSGTNGKNPFLDQRVRKAMSVAINRKVISKRIMQGDSTPATQLSHHPLSGTIPRYRTISSTLRVQRRCLPRQAIRMVFPSRSRRPTIDTSMILLSLRRSRATSPRSASRLPSMCCRAMWPFPGWRSANTACS